MLSTDNTAGKKRRKLIEIKYKPWLRLLKRTDKRRRPHTRTIIGYPIKREKKNINKIKIKKYKNKKQKSKIDQKYQTVNKVMIVYCLNKSIKVSKVLKVSKLSKK